MSHQSKGKSFADVPVKGRGYQTLHFHHEPQIPNIALQAVNAFCTKRGHHSESWRVPVKSWTLTPFSKRPRRPVQSRYSRTRFPCPPTNETLDELMHQLSHDCICHQIIQAKTFLVMISITRTNAASLILVNARSYVNRGKCLIFVAFFYITKAR